MTKADQIRLTLADVRPLLTQAQNEFLDQIWCVKPPALDDGVARTVVLKGRKPVHANKIGAIKTLRELTGMGLAESKDTVERAEDGFNYHHCCSSREQALDAKRSFEGFGYYSDVV